jgi:transcriptional regulator
MYLPPHFEENRTDELHRLIAAHPLGALVVSGPHGLDANHLPFELDVRAGSPARLLGHVARANPVWTEVASGTSVMVIFRAADAYISPNWYPTKQEHDRHVPTWNYQVVHVHGRIRFHDDATFVRGVVARLTHTHETSLGDDKRWKMTDAPREFIDQMVAAIVGLDIEVDRIVGKAKLGQNREERDRIGAAEELARRGKSGMSVAMKKALDDRR